MKSNKNPLLDWRFVMSKF